MCGRCSIMLRPVTLHAEVARKKITASSLPFNAMEGQTLLKRILSVKQKTSMGPTTMIGRRCPLLKRSKSSSQSLTYPKVAMKRAAMMPMMNALLLMIAATGEEDT